MLEAEMINFDQTLDAVERINDLLKSTSALEIQISRTQANLVDFGVMLEYAHRKNFRNAEEALSYIDQVLIPRLQGIENALTSGTEEHFQKLHIAREHTNRLAARLQMVTGGDIEGLPG
jgi:hypothetical protein